MKAARWRLPVAITALAFCLSTCWALLTPVFHSPDEPEHYDLITALAADPHYPEYDARALDPTVQELSRLMLNAGDGSRSPHLGGVAPKTFASTANLSDPPVGEVRYGSNQMPQHPPLYYESMAGVVRAMRLVHPGDRAPSIASEVLFLRIVNAALACTVPLAAVVALRLLRDGRSRGLAAGLAVLAVPQFSHISGSINNDNLLNVLAAWAVVAFLAILRRGLTFRRAAVAGLLVGLAAMTKAFGLLLVPILGVVLVVAVIRSDDRRRLLGPAALAAVLTGVLGGWFWLTNVAAHGSVAPTTFFERVPALPAGRAVPEWSWAKTAASSIPERFWLSAGRYAVTFPDAVWWSLTAVGAALAGMGLWRCWRSRRVVEGLVAVGPFVLTLAYVVKHAHSIYVRTGWTSFLQGRYLFVGLAGLAALVGLGLPSVRSAWPRRVGPVAVLGLQGAALAMAASTFWGDGDGIRPGMWWRAVGTWQPWPAAFVLLAGAGALVAALVLVLDPPPSEPPRP